MAALCFVAFRFFKIDIPFMGDKAALHLANAFVVLAALTLGPWHGAIAGAVGLSLADLLSDYVSSAPKTFVLKFCIGLIAGFVAHRLGRLNRQSERAQILRWTLLSASAALAFNVIFDPLVGYFYQRVIFGNSVSASTIIAKWSAGITFVNAVASVIFVTFSYMALRRPLEKAGFLRG